MNPSHETRYARSGDINFAYQVVGGGPFDLFFGFSEGGPLPILYAATYPERVQARILCVTFARATAAPDYPEGEQQHLVWKELIALMERGY